MNRDLLNTRWEGSEILVLRNDEVIDRLPAAAIQRVILVCEHGDTPKDLSFALFDLGTDCVILPPESGIAGRVHFERQGFWMQHPCIYWTSAAHAPLPSALRPGLWLLRRHKPGYLRLPASEMASWVEQWPLEGPQTWEQRKWARIKANQDIPPPRQAGPRST